MTGLQTKKVQCFFISDNSKSDLEQNLTKDVYDGLSRSEYL
jgi:hypothetical protein